MTDRVDPLVERFFHPVKPAPQGRPRLSLADVPPTEEGLRLLSSSGAWHSVAALAERLEAQHVDAATRRPTTDSLRFALCRVTAYFKMQQYPNARRFFDNVGDLFALAQTSAVVVPYSLMYLHALLPGLSGDLRSSQQRLYQLLEWSLTRQRALPKSFPMLPQLDGDEEEGKESRLWAARVRRCRRAIAVNHFECGQFGPSLHMMQSLVSSETDDRRRLLSLHQLGCLCLHSGNSFLAREVFKLIEKYSFSNSSSSEGGEGVADDPSLVELRLLLTQLDHALLLVFHGYFSEASNTLRLLTAAESAPILTSPSDETTATTTAKTTTERRKREEAAATHAAFREYVRIGAHSSLATCACFLHRNDADLSGAAPTSTVVTMLESMERVLREEPDTALKSDALLYCLARGYEMEGAATQQRLETVDALIDAYRCHREAAPLLKR